jgi:hypothetical protein
MSKVREALNMLQAALPEFPMGSDPHREILKTIEKIGKFISPTANVPGVQQTQLQEMMKAAQKNAMLQQVMASHGGGAQGPGGGAAPSPQGAPPPAAA